MALVSTSKAILELLSLTNTQRDIEPFSCAAITNGCSQVIPGAEGMIHLCAVLECRVLVTQAGLLQSFFRMQSTATPASSSWRAATAETQRTYLRAQLNNLFVQRIVAAEPRFAGSSVLYSFPWLAYCEIWDVPVRVSSILSAISVRVFSLESVVASWINCASAGRWTFQNIRTNSSETIRSG